ncbi:MAG TPA: hypothetical protein VEP48_08560 [Methylomirabilota bacterium]|nr:hypothetical protein [Methylomirabilota bacterium]
MRVIRTIALATLLILMFPTGVALAHGYDCWTAGPGYTVSCGDISAIVHQDNDYNGSLLDQFQTAATFSQAVYGSFDWQSIRIMNGYRPAGSEADFGQTWLYDSNGGSVYQASWWVCAHVDQVQYDSHSISAHNPTLVGTWQQDVQYYSCLDLQHRSVHTLNVHAYAN